MPNLYSRLRRIVTLAICMAFAAGHACAADTNSEGGKYSPSSNALADVQDAYDRAIGGDRRLLVVLGANWCHDSNALASRLGRSPLAELIQQNYELVFVSVGYLDKGRDVAQRLGVAHYYATPTVLIIDPASGQLINDEDRHQWSNAYNIDMSTSVQYFEKWSEDDSAADPVVVSAELQRLYAEIDEFEQQLAERVANGYAVVGPMLEASDAGNEPEAFDASWEELRKFRGAIPGDIRTLRDDARGRVSAGEQDIELQYPDYPLQSWESG